MGDGTVPVPAGLVMDKAGQSASSPAPASSGTVPVPAGLVADVNATPGEPPTSDPIKGRLPSDEEKAFLSSNPHYKWLPLDREKFPNREEGIYPSGPGNEWREDPDSPMHDTTQAPVDLHLLRHSLEGAAEGAVGAGGGAALASGTAAVATALPSVLPHTIAGVQAITTWAKANPLQAYFLFQVVRELIPGAKKMIGIVKDAPNP